MTFSDLMLKYGLSIKQISEDFHIPYRTVQNWKSGERQCPDYVMELIEYKICNEAKPKCFYHYGSPVSFQYTEKDFRDILTERKINYIDLPILDSDVVKYKVDGITKYAVIKSVIEGYKIYITETIPDDLDFNLLVEDIDEQRTAIIRNQEPCPMQQATKLYKMIACADKILHQLRIDEMDNKLKNKEITQEEYWKFNFLNPVPIEDTAIYIIRNIHYDKKQLLKMDHHDIDEESYLRFKKFIEDRI